MNSTIIGAVFTPYGYADIVKTKYRDGNRAILLISQENQEPIAALSVNLPGKVSLLGDDEIFIKAWSENEEIKKQAKRWLWVDPCLHDLADPSIDGSGWHTVLIFN